MGFVEIFKHELLRINNIFSQSFEACILLGSIIGILSVVLLRILIIELVQMHRSSSKLKKLYRKYNFWQKFSMQPAWQECLHAKRFCKVCIVCYHIRLCLLFAMLICVILENAISRGFAFSAFISSIIFWVMDIPTIALNLILTKPSIWRYKSKYRFRKYHNTQNHHSLF